MAGDWAPYRNGYWGWVEPWGWTWVAEEAWGFAPFHYGRWRVIDDRWGWMPFDATIAENFTPIYAPALVTFFATQDACAWVPLAPGEVYVPPYPVSQSYFQQINAPYVPNITRFTSVTTEKININQYLNRAAAAAVPRSVMSRSQPVRSAGRPAACYRYASRIRQSAGATDPSDGWAIAIRCPSVWHYTRSSTTISRTGSPNSPNILRSQRAAYATTRAWSSSTECHLTSATGSATA